MRTLLTRLPEDPCFNLKLTGPECIRIELLRFPPPVWFTEWIALKDVVVAEASITLCFKSCERPAVFIWC